MKSWIAHRVACRQHPRLRAAGRHREKAQEAQERKQQFDDLNITEEEEIADWRRREREGPRSASASCRMPRCTGTSTLVGTRPGAADRAAEAALDVHRPRHRRRERVCRARRLRAHHARRARADQDRGGAGRRARARDHPRRAQTHGERHSEEQGACSSARNEALSNRSQFLDRIANRAYEMVLENAFDRGDELDADTAGVALAQKVGLRAGSAGGFPARASTSATRIRPSETACSPRIRRPRSGSTK